jgi:hypothetical protein
LAVWIACPAAQHSPLLQVVRTRHVCLLLQLVRVIRRLLLLLLLLQLLQECRVCQAQLRVDLGWRWGFIGVLEAVRKTSSARAYAAAAVLLLRAALFTAGGSRLGSS